MDYKKRVAVRVAIRSTIVAVVALGWGPVPPALGQLPVGTAFTYQGRLEENGEPVTDTCDFRFRLYDAANGGNLEDTAIIPNISVDDGLFTVNPDFGDDDFLGYARWLEVAVDCPAGGGQYETLDPRQELTPAVYALGLSLPYRAEYEHDEPLLQATNTGRGHGVMGTSEAFSGVGAYAEGGCPQQLHNGMDPACLPTRFDHSTAENWEYHHVLTDDQGLVCDQWWHFDPLDPPISGSFDDDVDRPGQPWHVEIRIYAEQEKGIPVCIQVLDEIRCLDATLDNLYHWTIDEPAGSDLGTYNWTWKNNIMPPSEFCVASSVTERDADGVEEHDDNVPEPVDEVPEDALLFIISQACVRDPAWQCDGDVDGDGQVNPVDAGLVQAAFGSVDEQELCNYDIDCDGQINPVDAGIVQSLFGTCNAPRDVCP